MAAFADKIGADLLFLLIPPKEHLDELRFYQELERFLARRSIAFLNLTTVFLARGETAERVYWRRDEHLSPLGNRIVAEELAADVCRRYGGCTR